jgi:hypothetical protein
MALLLALHLDRPNVLDRLARVLDGLDAFPRASLSLRIPGPALPEIARSKAADRLRAALADERVELLVGGFHSPLLGVIPEQDCWSQLHLEMEACAADFGVLPTGVWLEQGLWHPELPRRLTAVGLRYALISWPLTNPGPYLAAIPGAGLAVYGAEWTLDAPPDFSGPGPKERPFQLAQARAFPADAAWWPAFLKREGQRGISSFARDLKRAAVLPRFELQHRQERLPAGAAALLARLHRVSKKRRLAKLPLDGLFALEAAQALQRPAPPVHAALIALEREADVALQGDTTFLELDELDLDFDAQDELWLANGLLAAQVDPVGGLLLLDDRVQARPLLEVGTLAEKLTVGGAEVELSRARFSIEASGIDEDEAAEGEPVASVTLSRKLPGDARGESMVVEKTYALGLESPGLELEWLVHPEGGPVRQVALQTTLVLPPDLAADASGLVWRDAVGRGVRFEVEPEPEIGAADGRLVLTFRAELGPGTVLRAVVRVGPHPASLRSAPLST